MKIFSFSELITKNNCQTLKVLDFSFSQNVSDPSANSIVQCQNLQELDIIGSSLSVKAVVFILSKCSKLKKFNAVRLAQAIEELDGIFPEQSLQLLECTPETDRCGFVTATSGKHLKSLAVKCSKLSTLSIFSENNYAPLDWNNNGALEDHQILLTQDDNTSTTVQQSGHYCK